MENEEKTNLSQTPPAERHREKPPVGQNSPKRLQNKTLPHAEKIEAKKFLEGEPIAKVPPRTIELKDMSKESKKAAKKAAKEWAKSQGEQRIERTEGEIVFNANGVDDSLSHSISQEKLDVLPVIPNIIKKGVTLDISDDLDGKPKKNILIAAPVETEKGSGVLLARAVQNIGNDT
jgi:hypothetical protein